jgi:hypothetical protein
MVASTSKLTDEELKRMQDDRKSSVSLRAQHLGSGLDLPQLTGFESENDKKLITAERFLRQTKIPTLKPLLPLFLRLKGKPYRLRDYFAFEPFFRTRMAKKTLLKTGRQVSKCFDPDALVTLWDGRRIRARDLKVGDVVMGRNDKGQLVPRRITQIFPSSLKDGLKVTTVSGATVKVSRDHRLSVTDRDNHTEDYRRADKISVGDYLHIVDGETLRWDRVKTVVEIEAMEMLDIEVEIDHNFILNDIVSHNSTSLAAHGVVFSNSVPYFSTLYITPLFEQIRRFSHQYVRQFIEESPVKRLFMDSSTTNSVLQRSFRNKSTMYFSYAFMDAERTRGIPADKNVIDEIQNIQYDFLQIIHETLSGSPWRLIQYAGTPLSLENAIQMLWEDSSQAEWMIKCRKVGCGYWNVPAMSHDLLDMIGKWHKGISEECPGTICADCGTPINPRWGGWVHAFPERRWSFAGYHVPQILMPIHYAKQEAWMRLVGKMHGEENTTFTTFLNEVCGESCDVGAKLVTETDLRAAAVLPWENRHEQALKHLRGYKHKILAVDWGGGGGRLSSSKKDADKRKRTSYTSIAVMGIKPDGKIDVIYGHRSLKTFDWHYEAALCLWLVQQFKCSHIVHDYGGAGAGREVMITQARFPENNLIPIRYVGPAVKNIMTLVDATEDHPREVYNVDKSRSLVTTCMCIKYGLIRFFKYDFQSANNPGLMRDFLSLIEEKTENIMGTDVYKIGKNPNASDDFAQAVNIGACALWYMTGAWPQVAAAAKFKLPPGVLSHVDPVKVDWSDF